MRPSPAPGVFVTGTGTGVGKTLVSACLVRAWGARYWKPVQTGLALEPGDGPTVAHLAGLTPERLIPPRHALQAPLSPHAAAALEGTTLTLADFALPPTDGTPLVVEGAGGVLVPLTDQALMVDLIAWLKLPVIVVASTALGTINHTLLTLEALRARALPVLGVILSGAPEQANRAAIERWGNVRVVGAVPALTLIDAAAVTRLANGSMPPLTTLAS